MTRRVCWNGCSFTTGLGFLEADQTRYRYDSLVSKQFDWIATNIAQNGSGNREIFMRSADAIMSGGYDWVFTQWSGLNRTWFYPGPDSRFCTLQTAIHEYRYRDIYLSAQQAGQFIRTVRILNHDFQNILDLIDYCRILKSLSQTTGCQCVFINGLVPWQQDLAQQAPYLDLDQTLSGYTKSILDFEHRPDTEIRRFFGQLVTHFQQLDKDLWVNLFDSMFEQQIDYAPLDNHPGAASHRQYASMVVQFVNNIQKDQQ